MALWGLYISTVYNKVLLFYAEDGKIKKILMQITFCGSDEKLPLKTMWQDIELAFDECKRQDWEQGSIKCSGLNHIFRIN